MKLGLGTVQFGQAYGISNTRGQVSRDAVTAILARAAEAKIDWLDTAANYGEAETVLGEANLKPFRIATKTVSARHGIDAVIARVIESSERLGSIDLLMVHSAADLRGPDGDALWTGLRKLKTDGVVGRIGISTYVADDPAALAERFLPDAMQVPFSLLDQRLLRDGSLERMKTLGVEIHARSLFLQGLLFLDVPPPRLQHAAPRLDEIRRHLADAGTTPLQAALNFVLSRPEIDAGIVGVTSVAELDEILAAAHAPLPALDWASLALDDEVTLTPSLW